MKGITIRFGDTTHQIVKREARHEGVSLSAFVREAATVRAAIRRVQRGDPVPWSDDDQYGVATAIRAYLEAERQAHLRNGD